MRHTPSERPFVSTQAGVKLQRLQRIQQMSSDLQARLQHHTQSINNWTGAGVGRDATIDPDEVLTRYKRLIGQKEDVFSGALPGKPTTFFLRKIMCGSCLEFL